MARLIPSDLTRLALAGAHQPEVATLADLQKALPDDYTVFHGVHWTQRYNGTTLFRQIDFAAFNGAGNCFASRNPAEQQCTVTVVASLVAATSPIAI